MAKPYTGSKRHRTQMYKFRAYIRFFSTCGLVAACDAPICERPDHICEGSIRYQFTDRSILTKAGDVLLFPKCAIRRELSETSGFYVIDFDTVQPDGSVSATIRDAYGTGQRYSPRV